MIQLTPFPLSPFPALAFHQLLTYFISMQQQTPTPHDSLFRQVFSDKEHAASFLQSYLPAHILNLLDLDMLTICKDSFVDKDLRYHYSDILYQTNIKSTPCFIYFLFEHKRTCEQNIALQLLRYMVRIWELYLKQKNPLPLPIIIPLVIYNGKHKWHVRTDFISLFHLPDPALKPFIPDFQYTVYDFSARSDQEIKGTVILQATLMALKYITGHEPAKHLNKIFSLFKGLTKSNTALEYIETLLTYIASTTDKITEQDIQKAIQQIDMEEIMPTLMQKWIEKGRVEGIILGAQEMLMDTLMERFGIPDPAISGKIKAIIDKDILKALHRLAIRVDSLQEFKEQINKIQ